MTIKEENKGKQNVSNKPNFNLEECSRCQLRNAIIHLGIRLCGVSDKDYNTDPNYVKLKVLALEQAIKAYITTDQMF